MASPLLHFLAQTRSAVLRPTTSTPPTSFTLVLGNPSCDLDSFISATIYSFFHSWVARSSRAPHLHIPILNLPSIPSSKLWRLRPEFGTALRLALYGQEKGERDRAEDADQGLLENLLTIADIRSTDSSLLNHLFCKPPPGTSTTTPPAQTPIMLVDHNAISIPGLNVSLSEISSKLDIIGCIDHHVDESSVPTTASPRVIKTGIGSCTSLVVQHLRDEDLWQGLIDQDGESAENDAYAAVELAKLSLAAILVDTTNLTAKGKVSDTDREVVSFLEGIINTTMKSSSTPHHSQETQPAPWDRSPFYEQISSSKADSLSLLSLPEIFDRDYKSWSEQTRSCGTELKLGVASVVKPIIWLIGKAESSSAETFVVAMRKFAREQSLDLFAVMTTSQSQKGEFQRELLLLDTGQSDEIRNLLEGFEDTARTELHLEEWEEDEELVDLLKQEHKRKGRIWWQRDVTKSRKQVGPLLKEAMKRV